MKRLIFALVSGAMGALVGALAASLTGRSAAIWICAAIGAALSLAIRPNDAVNRIK